MLGRKFLGKKKIFFLCVCLFCSLIEINSYYGNCRITGDTQSKEDAVYLPISGVSLGISLKRHHFPCFVFPVCGAS